MLNRVMGYNPEKEVCNGPTITQAELKGSSQVSSQSIIHTIESG